VALLTNPMETQLVASLGVKIGGTTLPPQPLQTVRGMVATGRDDAFQEIGESREARGPIWSVEAEERLARVPGFVRGMVKRIYADCGISHREPSTLGTMASQTSSVGWNGTRANTGIPNSRARASPASPENGPPVMFSMTPRHGAPRSRAARNARRTASSDSGGGIVTATTGGGSAKSSA